MNLKDPIFLVYCATNIKTQKQYIGYTSRDMYHRWRAHIRNAESLKRGEAARFCGLFTESLALHGDHNFELEILDTVYSEAEAIEREVFWIIEKKTLCPFGYNQSVGKEKFYNQSSLEDRRANMKGNTHWHNSPSGKGREK